MDGNPLVSIIIPAYNAEEYIAETLASAMAQTWANKEIIVINSGSTDNTAVVIKRFGKLSRC
ncbi:glycosyltransferase family 2 protein [Mucilaginibacter antarcticus]|uniref:glycosyltransferase family 2 protein n=1 Tax=Mucilaginibacter antarcticus TaxID=1855725 RepID=UPI00362E8A12